MTIYDLSSEECLRRVRGRSESRTKVLLPPDGIIEKKGGGLGKINYPRRRGNYPETRLHFGGKIGMKWRESSSGQWLIAWAGEWV